MGVSSGQIKLSRPDLYGKDYVSNSLSFKVSGMNLLAKEFRCISFDATDPNLETLSLAAARVRDAINAGFKSDNFVARVEFMHVANPDTGEEEQVISVKLNKVAVIQGVKKSGLSISNLQQVSFSAGELAITLSNDNNAHKGTEQHEGFDVPFANFNPNSALESINLDSLQDTADIYQEYEPKQDTDEKVAKAYESTHRNMGAIVHKDGSANYIIGEESKAGGMFSNSKVTFYTLGASSCGGCAGTMLTHGKTKKAANAELKEEFGKKAPVIELQAVEPESKHFAVYKSEMALAA
jgi:hypothetical protein